MPLQPLLRASDPPVDARVGDVVFCIAQLVEDIGPVRASVSHVGIAVENRSLFRFGDSIIVYHKDEREGIAKESWPQPPAMKAITPDRVDLLGRHPELTISERIQLIDEATRFIESGRVGYYLGKVDIQNTGLGMNCASFAVICYARAGHLLVDLDRMPELGENDPIRSNIARMVRWRQRSLNRELNLAEVLQPERFPLLHVGYIAGAFWCDRYPFNPT